jgi:hypothetical protein
MISVGFNAAARLVIDTCMLLPRTDHHFHFLLDYKSELYIDIINIINRYI